MKELVLVYISPSKGNEKISDWESKVKENFGPLSGYIVDLNNGKSIKDILLDILSIEETEGVDSYPNYLNIKSIYLEHIKSLQKELKEEDNTLRQEMEILESMRPSFKVAEILTKYGILIGIDFLIPQEKVYRHYDSFMGENVYKGKESPYKDYWEKMISDEKYVRKKSFKYENINLELQVFIFSKVKFKLLDITNFISSVTTNNNIGSGGNFNIQMNLASQKEIENGASFQDNNINITGYQKALFLQSIFRENDLVFIRFENLDAEKLRRNSDMTEGKNINTKIRGKYWDIIGLIDSTSITSTYNDININIAGRDLIKLLIEDYNFFIPIQFGNTKETIFGGGGTKIFNRLFSTGEYNLEFIKSFKSIENSIGFILSQLTNMQILSSENLNFLKEEYGDDLSKQFEYTQNGRKEKKKVINGIWGLVNYYVDENITHYRLADASLKSPDGSVLQQIHKVCQAPFVEIITDTFVDKYNIILRRPPFTIEDIAKQKFIVIGEDKTISESLEFNREVYTIYQLNAQGGCFVNNNSIPLAYLPMVILDEYVKMWGNKLYSQTFNYVNINDYTRVSQKNNKESNQKESFVDALVWLIEANAYLPFSRKGKIVIRGDRRIKIGQWIYFEKSNEIFYVEGVQHSANIGEKNVDRKTILTVSRGLVKDYVIQKVEVSKSGMDNDSLRKTYNYSNVSYGDLVDIDYLKEGLKELFVKFNKNFGWQRVQEKEQQRITLRGEETHFKVNSIVISEVFNFFLSGAEFEGAKKSYTKIYENLSAVSLGDLMGGEARTSVSHVFINTEEKEEEVKIEENQQQELLPVKGYKKVGENTYKAIY